MEFEEAAAAAPGSEISGTEMVAAVAGYRALLDEIAQLRDAVRQAAEEAPATAATAAAPAAEGAPESLRGCGTPCGPEMARRWRKRSDCAATSRSSAAPGADPVAGGSGRLPCAFQEEGERRTGPAKACARGAEDGEEGSEGCGRCGVGGGWGRRDGRAARPAGGGGWGGGGGWARPAGRPAGRGGCRRGCRPRGCGFGGKAASRDEHHLR